MASKRFLKNNLVQINAEVYEFGQIRKTFFGRGKCVDCGYKDNRFNSYKLIDHLSSKHNDTYDIKLLTPDYDVDIHTGQLISSQQTRSNDTKVQATVGNSSILKSPRAAKKSVINFDPATANRPPAARLPSNGELFGLPKNCQLNGENSVSSDDISSSASRSSTSRSPTGNPPKHRAFQSLDDIIDRIRRDRERMSQKVDTVYTIEDDDDDDDDVEIVLVTPYKGLS